MKKQWSEPQITEVLVKMTEAHPPIYQKAGTGTDSYGPEQGDRFVPCTDCICPS